MNLIKKDIDIRSLEENYRQQRYILAEGRNILRQELDSVFTNAGSEIKNMGLEATNSICNGCNEKSVELELSQKVQNAQDCIEITQRKALSIIESKLNELNIGVDNLENSEFSKELKIRLEGRMDSLPDNVKKILNSGNSTLKGMSNITKKNAYNAQATTGLKLSNFSGSNVHQIVLKAGKAIGYKFKPWQAIKMTQKIAVTAQILQIFGIVISVGMQIAEDVQTEKIRKSLEDNRIQVRSQFNKAANELEDFGKNFIKEIIDNNINPSIKDLDVKIRYLQESTQLQNENYKKLIQLQDSCLSLIQEIHK